MNERSHPVSPAGSHLRTFLWVVLVLGAVANIIASAAAASLTVQITIGVVTAVALAGLVALWTRDRT
ncbi:hypothetical protein [Aeromicrobium chenweiae]|uniref:Uncharacterized protein n=1 Tax=Aeromicrobium chenweiae TaxID=2079793 RepID=A0A2S0WJK7_9ACTN|nr:hypothetical protein [Aeromicrobium chenweiae]AWB91521.1 hypothetical protein C3E78_04400 [Aeromicrobium chenweiae]TGN32355.1 hypothetical protein E4L97_06365 [Aeromicrobium chenweiae]